jgi:hypothetical protein
MTWNTFHQKAQQLGFEVACRTRTAEGGGYVAELSSPPRPDQPWMCVGSYGHAAGLWAQPLTEQARALPPQRVAAMIAGCCEFVGTLADHDEEFQASLAPVLAAVANPEHGRMPA